MEKLYNYFVSIYLKEIADLEIGYMFNKGRLCYLRNILNTIYYLENTDLSSKEAIDIIETIIQ